MFLPFIGNAKEDFGTCKIQLRMYENVQKWGWSKWKKVEAYSFLECMEIVKSKIGTELQGGQVTSVAFEFKKEDRLVEGVVKKENVEKAKCENRVRQDNGLIINGKISWSRWYELENTSFPACVIYANREIEKKYSGTVTASYFRYLSEKGYFIRGKITKNKDFML